MASHMAAVVIAVLAFLALAAMVFVWLRRRRRAADGREVMLGLRAQILHLDPAEVDIDVSDGRPWGVVMDSTFDHGSASLVSLADGTASIYFSSGGGVIGGQFHEQVAAAAKSFVGRAAELTGLTAPAPDEQLPAPGYTRFFLLTPGGTRMAEASENDLAEGTHPLSPLFFAAQDVITQLRVVSESMR